MFDNVYYLLFIIYQFDLLFSPVQAQTTKNRLLIPTDHEASTRDRLQSAIYIYSDERLYHVKRSAIIFI